MILALGNSFSLESEAMQTVRDYVREAGEDIILFSQDKCLESDIIHYYYSNGLCQMNVRINTEWHDLSKFSKIWFLKPFISKELMGHPKIEYRHVISNQFRSLREAVKLFYPEKIRPNNPYHAWASTNKPYQLKVAQECGFDVPDTLITSEPDDLLDFYHKHKGNIIFKTVCDVHLIDKVFYTSKVTMDFLEKRDSLKSSPLIFQEEIKKEYELRITYINKELFVAKIDSQKDLQTQTDWRKRPTDDTELNISQCDIPKDIKGKVINFMSKMGLSFGGIDIIKTLDNKHVFLEVNENGQWYFFQRKTQMAIAKSLANLLISERL